MSEALSTSPASAPRPLPTWEATIAPLALPSIAMQRAGELAHLLGHRLAEGGGGGAGDRLDEHLPDVDGLHDPLRARPRGGGA